MASANASPVFSNPAGVGVERCEITQDAHKTTAGNAHANVAPELLCEHVSIRVGNILEKQQQK